MNSFQLTFTNAVGSVSLDEEPGTVDGATDTLTAYDASNTAVGSDSAPQFLFTVNTLTVSSATNNIKYFTITTDDGSAGDGIGFSNITWSCN